MAPAEFLTLQCTIGNRAVQKIVQRQSVDPGGRGIWQLPESDIAILPAADAAHLRMLQSAIPGSVAQLKNLIKLRRRAAGGRLAPAPGTPEHMFLAWLAYRKSKRAVYQIFKRWSAGHPSRMRNSKFGPARELAYRNALSRHKIRSRSAVLYTTSGQKRQIDLLIEPNKGRRRKMLQIKAGREALSTHRRVSGGSKLGVTSHSNLEALAADAEFRASRNYVMWAFEKSPSAPLVKQAANLGIAVAIRVDNNAEQKRLTGLFKLRGMTKSQINHILFFVGSREAFVRYVAQRLRAS